VPVPYSAAIRSLVEADRIGSARSLLAAALQEEVVDPACVALAEALAPPTTRERPATDVERDREYRWLDVHGPSHRGRWVAVEGETLLASAASLKELLAVLGESGAGRRPLIHHVER
jgi:hypothetical protein